MAVRSSHRSSRFSRVSGVAAVVVVSAGIAMPGTDVWIALPTMLASLVLGRGPYRLRWIGIGVAVGVFGSCAALLAGLQDWHEGVRELLFCTTWVGLPGLAGLAWRLRREVQRQAVEQIVQGERARQSALRRRHDAERLALAQSLHDDLGHALSLVALNLGRLELTERLEVDVREAVVAARRQLSAAVEQLGASVSVLREGSESWESVSEKEDMAVLIETARAAGVEVEVAGSISSEQLEPYDRETVGRVVKEALTNAVKHAPGQPVAVIMDGGGPFLRLVVDNPLPACRLDSAGGSGSGLIALSARLRELGGTLTTRLDDDAFRMEAMIPATACGATAMRHDSADSGEQCGSPVDVARRKDRMIVAGSLILAVVILISVEAFARFEAHRSVLPVSAFGRIQVGEDRARAEPHLPSNELLPRPRGPHGIDCHDYAVSFNWLGGRSGDIHRVCFADGIVTAKQRVDGSTDR